jgi:flagellar capping protein FliD
MSNDDLKRIEKKIDDLNKKLDTHIDKIWKVYEALRNPINVVSKMFKKK